MSLLQGRFILFCAFRALHGWSCLGGRGARVHPGRKGARDPRLERLRARTNLQTENGTVLKLRKEWSHCFEIKLRLLV